jgi:hypothetical protein
MGQTFTVPDGTISDDMYNPLGPQKAQTQAALKKNLDVASKNKGWLTFSDGTKLSITPSNKDTIYNDILAGKYSNVVSVGVPPSLSHKLVKAGIIAGGAAMAGMGASAYLGASGSGGALAPAGGALAPAGGALAPASGVASAAATSAEAAALAHGVTDMITITAAAPAMLNPSMWAPVVGSAISSAIPSAIDYGFQSGVQANPTNLDLTPTPKYTPDLGFQAIPPVSSPVDLGQGTRALTSIPDAIGAINNTLGPVENAFQSLNPSTSSIPKLPPSPLKDLVSKGAEGLGELSNLVDGAGAVASGLINRDFLTDQIDYMKSLITSPNNNPFTVAALDKINNRPNMADSPFYKGAVAGAGRDPNTPIFRTMESAVTNPNSVMGPNGPYGALANYYLEAERRKAASQGNSPGMDSMGALNQGAVDQIMQSLAAHVAPLYGQTLQSYADTYTAEQNALTNLTNSNISGLQAEQGAINDKIRTNIAGIDPYQNNSNAAIGAIGNMVGGVVDETDTAITGGGDIISNWLKGR